LNWFLSPTERSTLNILDPAWVPPPLESIHDYNFNTSFTHIDQAQIHNEQKHSITQSDIAVSLAPPSSDQSSSFLPSPAVRVHQALSILNNFYHNQIKHSTTPQVNFEGQKETSQYSPFFKWPYWGESKRDQINHELFSSSHSPSIPIPTLSNPAIVSILKKFTNSPEYSGVVDQNNNHNNNINHIYNNTHNNHYHNNTNNNQLNTKYNQTNSASNCYQYTHSRNNKLLLTPDANKIATFIVDFPLITSTSQSITISPQSSSMISTQPPRHHTSTGTAPIPGTLSTQSTTIMTPYDIHHTPQQRTITTSHTSLGGETKTTTTVYKRGELIHGSNVTGSAASDHYNNTLPYVLAPHYFDSEIVSPF